MKINFKKLKEVENSYRNNPITSEVLRGMVNILLNSDETGIKFGMNYVLATESLIELGILESLDKTPKVELLKS